MSKKIFVYSFIGLLAYSFILTPAFAHVIVYPHQVGIASLQNFTVSVPNERDNPVVAIRILIPQGVSSVLPNAIQGWTIATKESGTGGNATVSQIDWTNGTIPVGQRAEFVFQAQVPATPTTLDWKAYQTYSDGTVVSWDVTPSSVSKLSDAQQDELADKQNKGEYSTTQVVNDITTSSNTQTPPALSIILSLVAVIVSIAALVIAIRKQAA